MTSTERRPPSQPPARAPTPPAPTGMNAPPPADSGGAARSTPDQPNTTTLRAEPFRDAAAPVAATETAGRPAPGTGDSGSAGRRPGAAAPGDAATAEAERARLLLRRAQWVNAVLRARSAPVGRSPKTLVWSRNKSRLYRYVPRAPRRYREPLLIIYSLINRPYVVDLQPGASLVEYLLDRGFAVYLLDWGAWGPEDRGVTLDHLVLELLPRFARRLQRDAESEAVSALGYCMGGTLALVWAALQPEFPLRNLVCLAAPVEFTQAGLFSLWLDPAHLDVDRVVDTCGNVPPEVIDVGAKMLRPLGTLSTWLRLYDRVEDNTYVRSWQAMNRWVNEGVPFPGAAFRQWVKLFYQQNRLARGELELGGRRVDLRNVHANLLSISAQTDDIAPFETTNAALDLVGSPDRTGLQMPGGHVSMVVGRAARQNLWPKLADWLAARSTPL